MTDHPTSASGPTPGAPGQKTILLIEDDREIASTIRSVLDSSGYKTIWAQNGVDGQRAVETYNPDLVITDMMMPRMGGFPVLEYLKALPNPPRVIMITANEGGRHKAYAEMLGVDDYLRKPFAMDVMLESIERIFSDAPQKAAKGAAGPLRRKAAKKKTP